MTRAVWVIVVAAVTGLAAAAAAHIIIEHADGRLFHF